MNNAELLWQGKSQKCHFHIGDFAGIVIALIALVMQLKIFAEWCGKTEEYFMCIFLLSIIFYESLGKFILRVYYVKKVRYELYEDKLIIKLKVAGWDYVREFFIKDISAVKIKKYKKGLGSIHFGDAETMYWRRRFLRPAQYEGLRDDIDISVTTSGLFRPKNKWNSGIIYSVEQVEKIYRLLDELIE